MESVGTLNMTRSYFRDIHGIILVSNSNVEGSLHALSEWIMAARNYSTLANELLVISLWVDDNMHTQMPLVQDFLKEWSIPIDLLVSISICSGSGIVEGFRTVVNAVVARHPSPRPRNSSVHPNPPTKTVSHCCSN